jgi:hypothetical protein
VVEPGFVVVGASVVAVLDVPARVVVVAGRVVVGATVEVVVTTAFGGFLDGGGGAGALTT